MVLIIKVSIVGFCTHFVFLVFVEIILSITFKFFSTSFLQFSNFIVSTVFKSIVVLFQRFF